MIEMEEQAPFQTGHEGLIHDIAYDHFGTRLATASSDRVIRLFSRGAAGEWQEDCALTGTRMRLCSRREPCTKVEEAP